MLSWSCPQQKTKSLHARKPSEAYSFLFDVTYSKCYCMTYPSINYLSFFHDWCIPSIHKFCRCFYFCLTLLCFISPSKWIVIASIPLPFWQKMLLGRTVLNSVLRLGSWPLIVLSMIYIPETWLGWCPVVSFYQPILCAESLVQQYIPTVWLSSCERALCNARKNKSWRLEPLLKDTAHLVVDVVSHTY